MKNNEITGLKMEPFIRSDQYNFIRYEIKKLVQAHVTSRDPDVLNALKASSFENINNLFLTLNEKQLLLMNEVIELKDEIQAEQLVKHLKSLVRPFTKTTEKTVTKLFPKAKKLKIPSFDEMDFRDFSYISWYDIRSERKYLIIELNGKLIGFQGTFRGNVKGICAICNRHEDVGLFMTSVKSGVDTYTNRGNYICKDSVKCNQNITTLDKLYDFIEILKK
ncbi:FusB/FusC family EF-G-binding protein [Bacillus suaedae]|uniref:FusB/FusC family EF-G-binding protein n=1 Tax=Halalkalibacter suaedae TaxID=2822140 RepID=A0A940WYQ8_9BACI|nr:FusB/FusC family EF-G-binding protein [Bacillus suaedae]MBP3953238.1 FusB/FusC family EF-G-binding protein [Bacillus suaedae]